MNEWWLYRNQKGTRTSCVFRLSLREALLMTKTHSGDYKLSKDSMLRQEGFLKRLSPKMLGVWNEE